MQGDFGDEDIAQLQATPLWHDRCCLGRPPHHWKTMTFLAELRCDRIEAPWVLDYAHHQEVLGQLVDGRVAEV
jgi:hypothetical protein